MLRRSIKTILTLCALVLVFSFGNIGKVNASSEDQSGKELAIELIENSNAKDKWKEFSEDDNQK